MPNVLSQRHQGPENSICRCCARGDHPHASSVAKPSPERSDERRHQRAGAENQAAPECNTSGRLHTKLADVDREERHHERVSEVQERAGDRDGNLIFAPLRQSHRLFEDSQQTEYGLRVLNAAVVDQLKGFITANEIDFDDFILVGVNLRFCQFGRLV